MACRLKSKSRSGSFRPTLELLESRHLLDAAVLPTPDVNQRLVGQLYLDLLNRDADPSGLTYWAGKLQAGTSTTQIISQLEASGEYRSDVVQSLYARYLARPADAGGLQYFVQFLAQGGSADGITVQLLESTEYFHNRAGSDNGLFLTALYHDVLGRPVDATAIASFQQPLTAGLPRDAVVRAVLKSGEATQIEVDILYQRLLLRPADSYGLNLFSQALEQGTPSENVITALAGSGEYYARVTDQSSAIPSRTLRYTQVVEKVFSDFLARSPGPQEITDWVSRFGAAADAGQPITTPLLQFLNSSEALQTWVAKWLQNYLGENGSLDQLKLSLEDNNAVNSLSQGADFADVLAGLLSTDSFYQAAGRTDTGLATSLYETILKRTPTPTELSEALANLASGTRQDEARSLLQSGEFASLLVTQWFADYLGGGPSPAEIAAGRTLDFWSNRLQAYRDPFAVLAEILASQDFLGFRPDLYDQPDTNWAPAPGPFAQPVTVQRGEQPTFQAGDPVLTTNYFYWYDAVTGTNVRNADGTSALTNHPLTLDGFSYLNQDWHAKQLQDMADAGIDVALAVSYSTPFSDPHFNDSNTLDPGLLFTDLGLPPMVAARHQLLRQGTKAPALGMFYDTTSLSASDNSKHYQVDLSTYAGKMWFYDAIRNFFSHIPASDWARIDGKPLIFLYHLGFGSGLDENLMSFVRSMFQKDFGVDVYLVAPDETLAPGVAFSPASQPWVNLLHQSDALTVLSAMLAGTEFYSAAGGTNGGFIDRLYDKLLDRPADPYGRAAWIYGLSATPRQQIVNEFLYSDESLRILVAGWFQHYLRRLDSLPDLAASPEIDVWVSRLANHEDAQTVLAGVLATPEFYAASGGTDAALIDNLYQRVLLRNSDVNGKNYWLNRLTNVTREQMIIEFLHTDEAYQVLVGTWLQYYLGHYWGGRVDAEYDWGGALAPAFRDVAEFGPGYDQSAARSRPPLVVSRDDGNLYRSNWSTLLAMNPRPWLVDLETWDELIEGSDLCETQEFGRMYIDLTRQYADQFHGLSNPIALPVGPGPIGPVQ
jgi:hypothetical protein